MAQCFLCCCYLHVFSLPAVPDLSQLDPKLVQLLALQRILQLLTHQSVAVESSDNTSISATTSTASSTTTRGNPNHSLHAHPDQIMTELDASGLSEREKLILNALRQHVAALSPLPPPPPSLLPPSKGKMSFFPFFLHLWFCLYVHVMHRDSARVFFFLA